MSAALARWASNRPGGRIAVFGLLFVAALGLLGLGIWEPTGVTGKDEYYLGLRTPLCMLEQEVWLVPCLDGEPRLRKPPLVYWLTRASFELFGPSLASARGVAVVLAALLVLGIALVGTELTGDLALGLRAGVFSLSCLGLAVGGRMLELDVPVASFSTLAFYALLRWYRRGRGLALILAAVLLAAGFLTKGPVVGVVCGAGGLALLAAEPAARVWLRRQRWAALGAALLAVALTLPWFLAVQVQYPQASLQALTQELAARRFWQPSPVPLYGVLLLGLPWAFLIPVLPLAVGSVPEANRRLGWQLLAWLAITLLPFFLFRSFERYLMGSLVPLALILALVPPAVNAGPWRWTLRLGMLVCLGAGLTLVALVGWFGQAPGAALLGLATLAWFAREGWRGLDGERLALAATLLWACLLGLVYPRLGINAVPPALVEQARAQPVVFYQGPQPGLLPALVGRSLVHLDERWRLPPELLQPCARFLLLASAEESAQALAGLEHLGYGARDPERFGVLSARILWYRMLAPGTTRDDLWRALATRDLDPLKPQVLSYQVENRRCGNP